MRLDDELILKVVRYFFIVGFSCKHNFSVHESCSLNKVYFESYWELKHSILCFLSMGDPGTVLCLITF